MMHLKQFLTRRRLRVSSLERAGKQSIESASIEHSGASLKTPPSPAKRIRGQTNNSVVALRNAVKCDEKDGANNEDSPAGR